MCWECIELAKKWYVLRVATNREDDAAENLRRKVAQLGKGGLISQVLVPKEKVSETRRGRRIVREHKIYPGYIMVEMELNDEAKLIIKETPGVGDVLGTSGGPTPLRTDEVEKLLAQAYRGEEVVTPSVEFSVGERVRVKEGPFENWEGVVEDVSPEKGMIRVAVEIFGRSTPVELEQWQVEKI